MKKTRTATQQQILIPTRSSLFPTQLAILKHPGTGAYQWWGNDGHPYSPPNDDLEVVVSKATSNALVRI